MKARLPDGSALRVLVFPSVCSTQFLSEPDEKSFGASDIAQSIHVLVLDDFAYEPRTVLTKPFERLVEVIDSEHYAEVAESIDRRVPVICNNRRLKKAG